MDDVINMTGTIFCKRKIHAGRGGYGEEYLVFLFNYGDEELHWATSNKSKAVKYLEEGKYYELKWKLYGKDSMGYVKFVREIPFRDKFTEIEVGDRVRCYDEYSHDYIEHDLIITSIEYEPECITTTNPRGMICYGDDMDKENLGDDYIEVVTEGNFTKIMNFVNM